MSKKITFVLTALFGALAASASLIQVSVTGTADTTEMGYTQGESYTFNWIVNDGYTGAVNDEFDSSQNLWYVHRTVDPFLWTSVSGDGLTGTYSRPTGAFDAPHEELLTNSDGLYLRAGDFDPAASSMGLLVNGVEVWDVIARDLTIPGLNYSNTSFVNPAIYLESYIGTYSDSGGEIRVYDENLSRIDFAVSGITIGVVPEPSTVLLFSVGGIGAWILRRNRVKGEAE